VGGGRLPARQAPRVPRRRAGLGKTVQALAASRPTSLARRSCVCPGASSSTGSREAPVAAPPRAVVLMGAGVPARRPEITSSTTSWSPPHRSSSRGAPGRSSSTRATTARTRRPSAPRRSASSRAP
jgi:hypothetical protein